MPRLNSFGRNAKLKKELIRGMKMRETLTEMLTNRSESVLDLSVKSPVFLVFLRHFGCNFCREGLAQIAKQQVELTEKGFAIVFVHMSDNEIADKYLEKYNLSGHQHVSDPTCYYYEKFGLLKGTTGQLYGLLNWVTGVRTSLKHGNDIGPELGDAMQMPGVFIVHKAVIVDRYIYDHVADYPDYLQLTMCCK
jgi:peroxiredoxin